MCTQHAHEQRMKRVHVTTLAVVQRGAAEHANASMRHAMLWGLLHAEIPEISLDFKRTSRTRPSM